MIQEVVPLRSVVIDIEEPVLGSLIMSINDEDGDWSVLWFSLVSDTCPVFGILNTYDLCRKHFDNDIKLAKEVWPEDVGFRKMQLVKWLDFNTDPIVKDEYIIEYGGQNG